MITTKRQINTASDRFGGYASSRIAPAYVEPEVPSDISSMKSYSPENNIMLSDPEPTVADIRIPSDAGRAQAPKVEEPLYSTRETMKQPELPKRPEKEKTILNREDLMPSIKTQRAVENVSAQDKSAAKLASAVPVRRERNKLSPRTKVLLFVYVAIALVLAIAVIATGVSISNVSAESDVLQAKIAQQTNMLNATTAQLVEATDPDELRAKASELGMVEAGEPSESITLVDRTDYPTAKPHTNGFDTFMDWISNVLL
ncbi:MAG: hypothetical protein K2M48_04285 [Clostridiales bacterium]|nr:hypothetical protein [Clostridiales bacterium]